MSLPKYREYKDSGVEWLGNIPKHWRAEKFKWQIDRNEGGVWGDDPNGQDDTIVLRSTEQTINGDWRIDDPATRKLSKFEIDTALLVDGDLLITKSSGSSLHIGKTTLVTPEIAKMRCCYSNFMQRIRMRTSFLPRLAWQILNNEIARRQFDILSNSTTGLANLNGTMVGQILVPIPTLNEQSAIVMFLDRETSKIDSLISEQEKLIELLKEKRQAIISHAVTKGLNPDVEMKDSGVEWLGRIPKHWKMKANKYFLKQRKSIVGASCANKVLLSLSLQGVIVRDIDSGKGKYPAEFNTYLDVLPNDLIFCLFDLDETPRTVGISLKSGMITSAYDIFTCLGCADSKFVYNYYLNIDSFKGLRPYYTGLRKVVRVPTFLSIKIALPPIEEQITICSFLDHETAKIDELTIETYKVIELLKERRSALISAAVTGQIDVRNFVPKEAA